MSEWGRGHMIVFSFKCIFLAKAYGETYAIYRRLKKMRKVVFFSEKNSVLTDYKLKFVGIYSQNKFV